MKYLKLFENFNPDEIRSNIKDILLDIEDKGIYTNVYLDIWKKSTMLNEATILISNIDLENISSSSMNPFTIDNDFFTTLEHLNSYLDSEDYRLSTISFRAKDHDGLIQNDGCDDLDELKRLIEVWNYDSFESITLKYKSKIKYKSKSVLENYLKIYEDFNNKEKELETMFGLVMGTTEVYKIPYSYYGEATKERRDFDIYVVSGTRQESDDHKLVQELYHNHNILNELLNLEFFYINLTKEYVTIVLYDWTSSFNKNNKNHLSSIYTSKLPLPQNIKRRLKFSKTTSRLSVRPDGDYLNRGIDWSDGRSSNIALFDRIYDPKEKVSESINDKSTFISIIKDKLLELSDIGFLAYVEDKNDEPLLEDMIRITVEKSYKRSDRTFEFSECKDLIEDLILTNKEMEYYGIYHLVITPESGYNSVRLVYKDGIFYPEGNSVRSSCYRVNTCCSTITNPNLNYIGKLKRVELFFEYPTIK